MEKIQLSEKRSIGRNELPFIIAEIGNNHNGDLELAKEMMKICKKINVDAVKFQVKDIETAFSKELLDKPYTGPNSFGKTYREHKEALEFSRDELKIIYDYAKELEIICFATPFDVKSVNLLEELDNPIYKISSFHVTDLELIDSIAKTSKPIILSTGMSSIDEIDAAVKKIREHHDKFIVLQCTSCYPTEDEDVNLRVIPTLEKRYQCPVGFSSHERGVAITSASVAMGATVIERHFTLDRTMKGPDHASSIEESGMELVVKRTKRLFVALGSDEKKVLDSELGNRQKFRGY
ncbi:N-acetylneuraminate synthase family protein [Candidatus Nitrosopelagicus sp.]|nr:N-acetylneuraminate synthase family protein [Candidatus Nitrosopelagicus sp.]